MLPHPLQLAERINEMIRTDTRPEAERQRFSHRTGLKRTHLLEASATPAGDLAGALPTKQQTQTTVANMGNSTWGTFSSGPLTADAINQGQLADCYLLIAMYLVARLRPNFFDDIFIKVDDKTVIVQWFYQGYILQIRTSLLISTDYNHPANGDVRPELAEKTWCIIKAAISDYAADNFGLIASVFAALGLDASYGTLNSAAIIAAMQAGKAVGIQTRPDAAGMNSLEQWIAGHAYGVIDFDAATRNLTLAQPWYAVKRITGVAPATVEGGKVFNLVHVGTFPAAPRILASMATEVSAMPPTLTINIGTPGGSADGTQQRAWSPINWGIVASPDTTAITVNGAAVPLVKGFDAAGRPIVTSSGSINLGDNASLTIAAVATGPGGSTPAARTVTVIAANTQTNMPADDPIQSVVVTTTRKSGKVTTTIAG